MSAGRRAPVAAALAAAAIALAGCSQLPRYERPAPAIPSSWPVGDAYLRASEAGLPALGWRDVFRDARLQALVERALATNQDLAVAAANVASARGLLRAQRGAALPQVDAGLGASVGRTARSGPVVVAPNDLDRSLDASVGLSAFEIDLFGRLASLTAAAREELFATEAAVRATRLSLTAEVARAWLAVAADRSLLAIARDTEASASRSVELTRARLSGGVAPRSELRQAETVLAQARADVADLTTLVAQDRNALVLLVGGPVDDAELAGSIESADDGLAELPAGLDSGLLLRRPDVLETEYRLRAADARIGAARAALFPRISLTAVAGLASTSLAGLFSSGAFAWSAGPALSVPIFDGGVRRGNLDATLAQRDAALADYQRTIQGAFREVADALARRGTIEQQVQAQAQLEAAARDTAFLADARYRGGVDSFLANLDAQRTLYSARRSLASALRTRAENLVELYRSLGGDATAGAPEPASGG